MSKFILNVAVLVAVALMVCSAIYGAPARADAPNTKAGTLSGVVTHAAAGARPAVITLQAPFDARPETIAAPAARALDGAWPGDIVKVTVDDVANPAVITGVTELDRPVGRWPRLLAFALALAAVGLAVLIASRLLHVWPNRFVIGVDNRYSNSQTQLALWFSAVAVTYLALAGLRVAWLGWDYLGGVGITTNLAALTGLSALSFGSAKAITSSKVAAAMQNGQANPKPAAARANLAGDLLTNDNGMPDLGDLQMLLITLVTVAIFGLTAFHTFGQLVVAKSTSLPDLDTTLLSAFGLGQGAYLAKKAAVPVATG